MQKSKAPAASLSATASRCTEETVIQKEKRLVHITINGKDVPMGEFVQNFIMKTVAGMLSALKKVELENNSEIEIKIKYKQEEK